MSIRSIFAHTAVVATLLAAAVAGLASAPRVQAQAAQCTTVGTESGEGALTALIVVSGKNPVTITGAQDATGCDIGVYIAPGAHATITYADIYATTQGTAFGVYNDGGQVVIEHTQVRNILGNGASCGDEDEESCGGGDIGGSGESRSYTGGRHGTGILFVGAGARGTISASVISNYGRRGISVSGPGVTAQLASNQIIASTSPVSWLNGIWIANGARATIANNTISGNRTPGYMGKSSTAITVAGGASHNGMPNYTTGIQISGNTLTNNDTGVLLSNVGLSGTTKVAPATKTSNLVTGNQARVTYTLSVNDTGVKDAGGNGDRITGNTISGYGSQSISLSPLVVNTVALGNTIS